MSLIGIKYFKGEKMELARKFRKHLTVLNSQINQKEAIIKTLQKQIERQNITFENLKKEFDKTETKNTELNKNVKLLQEENEKLQTALKSETAPVKKTTARKKRKT